ncbi:MAG: flagellar motor switch protein FliN [Armatimonadetes bacterium]|nr:flagellar motor switch protein FliN [Armatimonadota bacterium]
MSSIAPEIISKFSNLQTNIWQNVALAVSEAAGQEVSFADALTMATSISDLYSEMSSPKLILQFAFADQPENSQVVMISQETLVDLYNTFTGGNKETIDENSLSEIRPAIEGIVQGMCIAAGNLLNEAIVASGLSIRLQIFSLPPNMQSVTEVIRTNVRIAADGLNGSLIWLADEATVRGLLGQSGGSSAAQNANSPFDADPAAPKRSQDNPQIVGIEDTGLELLLDIPLEVSVELGRVKMVVKDVIDLGSGSIVEIDKAAGEPVDVMVNGRLVARGEVVVIEDNFGVRITEILSPADRIARLNEVA